MSEDREMHVTIIGYDVGIASGWDEWDEHSVVFYDFIPNDRYKSWFDKFSKDMEYDNLYVEFDIGKVGISSENFMRTCYIVDFVLMKDDVKSMDELY